jgi:hypothetical protein
MVREEVLVVVFVLVEEVVRLTVGRGGARRDMMGVLSR